MESWVRTGWPVDFELARRPVGHGNGSQTKKQWQSAFMTQFATEIIEQQ